MLQPEKLFIWPLSIRPEVGHADKKLEIDFKPFYDSV
jgi:hypothetical protein